jgi:hypothetical protein
MGILSSDIFLGHGIHIISKNCGLRRRHKTKRVRTTAIWYGMVFDLNEISHFLWSFIFDISE